MTVTMAIVMITLLCLITIVVDWLILVISSKKLTKRIQIILLLLASISGIAGLIIMILVGYVQPVFNDSMSYHEDGVERIRDGDSIVGKMQGEQTESLDKAQKFRKYDDTEFDEIELSEMNDELSVIAVPNVIDLYEQVAINICVQRGYKYKLEFYLGGDGTVVSQFPTAVNNIETGADILLNIGISDSKFSDKLLALINKKRRILGLGELYFSDQLNTASAILSQGNVDLGDRASSDDSQWLAVVSENNISLRDGFYMTMGNISSLSDANERIWHIKDSDGSSLLNASYNKIGMAYTDNDTLIIIVGY